MYGSAVLGLGLGLGLRNRQILLDEDENETVRRSGVSRGWERFRLDTLLGLHYKRLFSVCAEFILCTFLFADSPALGLCIAFSVCAEFILCTFVC